MFIACVRGWDVPVAHDFPPTEAAAEIELAVFSKPLPERSFRHILKKCNKKCNILTQTSTLLKFLESKIISLTATMSV